MNLNTLIQLLQNKLSLLQTARGQAYAIGDFNQLNTIDSEILETQSTITQLATLSEIAKAATSVNASLFDVAASGIDAIQNPTPIVQGPSASAVINGYDVSAYATDPLYEEKIHNILNVMPTFSVVGDVDAYIQGLAPGSPVTGIMVYAAVQQYAVDLPLLVAIIQNDSSFGTLGVGARTFNPGNVGNTGSATRTYPSWEEGVSAVADWLNRHRVVTPVVDIAPVTPTDPQINTNVATVADVVPVTVPPVVIPPPIPEVVLPTTPIVPVVTAATFIVPTANATTTPIVIPTDTATSTPAIDFSSEPIDTSTATTTDATATSTPDIIVDTPPDTGSASTTIPVIHLDDASNVVTTPDSILQDGATSTPDVTATSTQARALSGKRKKGIA
jgi:hypothetical protein